MRCDSGSQGRRETYRLEGNYVLKQQDIDGLWRRFPDAVSVGGWTMDDHPAEGFYAFDRKPCRQAKIPGPYNIPYRCICSKNIGNLMMAGRNISCSHVAFTSTRVMHVRIFGPGSWHGGCNMPKRGGFAETARRKSKTCQ